MAVKISRPSMARVIDLYIRLCRRVKVANRDLNCAHFTRKEKLRLWKVRWPGQGHAVVNMDSNSVLSDFPNLPLQDGRVRGGHKNTITTDSSRIISQSWAKYLFSPQNAMNWTSL